MADVVIDCAQLARDGILVADYRAPVLSIKNRYLVRNNGRMGVFVETGTEQTKLTMAIPQTVDGQNVFPREIIVPPNSLYGLGDWPPAIYNDAKSQVAFKLSSVTGVRLFCACVS